MSDTITTVTSAKGVPFNVRLVRQGEHYGLNDCLTHDEPATLVEFYDASQDPEKFGARGQFVSRYYTRTLLADRPQQGLCLCGHVRQWDLDAASMNTVLRWLREQ